MSSHFYLNFLSVFSRFKLPRQSHRQAKIFLGHQTKSYLLSTTKHIPSNTKITMTNPLNTLDIIMIHRQADGEPKSLIPYNGHQAAHVTACVNLARAILASEEGKQSFISLGDKLVRKSKPQRWWGEDTDMKHVVKSFVELVTTNWPPLFIEETLKSPDLMGATFRKVWEGSFDTRKFPICINAGVGRQ